MAELPVMTLPWEELRSIPNPKFSVAVFSLIILLLEFTLMPAPDVSEFFNMNLSKTHPSAFRVIGLIQVP
jgi:hypothetical protein